MCPDALLISRNLDASIKWNGPRCLSLASGATDDILELPTLYICLHLISDNVFVDRNHFRVLAVIHPLRQQLTFAPQRSLLCQDALFIALHIS